MRKAIRVARWIAALAVGTLGSICVAQNLTFLKHTPGVALTEEDRKLQLDAAMAVVSDPNPRFSKEWKNPATGHSGSFQGLGDLRSDDGLHCRKIKIITEADGRKNQMTFPLCLTAEGDWMIASGKKLTEIR